MAGRVAIHRNGIMWLRSGWRKRQERAFFVSTRLRVCHSVPGVRLSPAKSLAIHINRHSPLVSSWLRQCRLSANRLVVPLMGRKVRSRTHIEVAKLKKPGMHAVGDPPGLVLRVRPEGSRSWILRALVLGKRRHIGLGPFPEVALADAREAAKRHRATIREGRDPLEEARALKRANRAAREGARTFRDTAEEYMALKLSGHAAKSLDGWRESLARHAYPVIGNDPIAEVGRDSVLRVLQPIWQTTTETASRVRGRIEAILAFATVRGYRTGENPARWRGNLDVDLPKPRTVAPTRHHAALPWQQVPAFFARLAAIEGSGSRALELAILTASRSGEVRGARWEEFDLSDRMWRIPGARMKAKREHRVPLSRAVLELLDGLPGERSGLLFSSAKGTPISDMTLSAVLRRMEVPAVPHGFRSSFRDWCSESEHNIPDSMAELALAHRIASEVEAAYRRGDLVEKRRAMMEQWAEHCLAEVVRAKGEGAS
jgi:integrase